MVRMAAEEVVAGSLAAQLRSSLNSPSVGEEAVPATDVFAVPDLPSKGDSGKI